MQPGDEPFDFVFIDADKENNAAYLEWAVRLGRPGTTIVVDNVIRGGKVLTEADDVRVAATRGTLQLRGEHPRLDTAVLHLAAARWPPHVWLACDPADDEWFRGNDRLHEKLAAYGVPHATDFDTTRGGHTWAYHIVCRGST